MRSLSLLCFIAIVFFGCRDDRFESEVPDVLIYQIVNHQGFTVPVQIMDYLDGTGLLTSRIVYDNTDTTFDAIFDYVNNDRTTFSLITPPDEIGSEVIGSGYFTGDYIEISIVHPLFTDTFVGYR